MVPELRRRFNDDFTPEKYKQFLKRLHAVCGTEVEFRVCETPCFFRQTLIDELSRAGSEMVRSAA